MTENCPDWVDAAPFRTHVRDLICETGLSWRLIAAHADIAPRAIRSLLHGRRGAPVHRIHVTTARALATTSAESIAADNDIATAKEPSRQLLTALREAGHDAFVRAHLSENELACLDDPEAWQCSRATAARVLACYDTATSTHAANRGASPGQCLPTHV